MKPHLKISLIYFFVGISYILLSDHLIYLSVRSTQLITEIQSYKGILFVFISAALVYLLVRKFFNQHIQADQERASVNRQLKDTMHSNYLIFKGSPLPSFIIEAKSLRFLQANEAAEKKFGRNQKEFDSCTLRDIVTGISKPGLRKLMNIVSENGYAEIQVDGIHKNGSVFNQQVFCQLVQVQSKPSVFMILLDISSSKNSDRVVMDKMIDVLEEERSRLSGEIHDGIKQYFGIIHGLLQTHVAEYGNNKYLENAISSAEHGIEESRRLSHKLAPGFNGFQLKNSLKHLVENLNILSQVRFSLQMPARKRYSQEIELNLYRIVQEASNNILTHSKARSAMIQLMERGKSLMLKIADDGIGLDDTYHSKSLESIGMKTMRTRATRLKGNFNIFSKEGKGTTINVSIPLI